MRKNDVFVFSIALEGYQETYKSCITTIIDYSNRNNYDFSLVDSSPRELLPIEAAWLKIPLILEALKAGYKWVAFIDCDIDIRPHTPELIFHMNDLDSEKSIFISTGKSGRLNSGLMIIKNTESSVQFFEQILQNCNLIMPEHERTAFENGHIIHYSKNSDDIVVLDHVMWNNNSHINENSYIQHYSSGVLRDWYFSNRTVKQSLVKKAFTKLTKKLTNNSKDRKGLRPAVLSESLKEIMPFYQEKYLSSNKTT